MSRRGRRTNGRHEGVTCDGCGIGNFPGLRHKCMICYDYDLCHSCAVSGVSTKDHNSSHPLQAIVAPSQGPDFDIQFDSSGTSFLNPLNGSASNIIGQNLLGQLPFTLNYNCPYCSQHDLTEFGLHEHVFSIHPEQNTPVICPVCAHKPGGDPTYVSRDFLGHLDSRHKPPTDKELDRLGIKKKMRKGRRVFSEDLLSDIHQSPFSGKNTNFSSHGRISKSNFTTKEEPLSMEAKIKEERSRIMHGLFVQELLLSTIYKQKE